MPSIFLKDICKNNWSIEDTDNEESGLFKMIGNLNKGKKISEKSLFQKIQKFYSKREKIFLMALKVIYFQ